MEIKISRDNVTELNVKKVIWSTYNAKKLSGILVLFTVAVITLLSIPTELTSQKTTAWWIQTTFGIVIIIIALLRITDFLRNKSTFLSANNNPINHTTELVINENEIIYYGSDFSVNYKWSFYKAYSSTKDAIFLKKSISPLSNVVILKNELNSEQLEYLTLLLAKKNLRKV